jgi:putative heme-binding domain-containing protein
VLLEVLASCGDDRLIPAIVWQNLHPLLEGRARAFLALIKKRGALPNLGQIMPRAVERVLAQRKPDPGLLLELFGVLAAGKTADTKGACRCLALLADKVQNGELAGAPAEALRKRFGPVLRKLLADRASPLRVDAALLAACLKEPEGIAVARAVFLSKQPEAVRLRALDALISARAEKVLAAAEEVLGDRKGRSPQFRGQVLASLGKLDDAKVAKVVLAHYAKLEPDLRPRVIELLTQRPVWGKALVKAVADKKVPADALNVNQLRRLLASKDPALVKEVTARWGTVREGRNPEREKVVQEMRKLLSKRRGDARKGIQVFKNLCAQCHKIHGEGQDVGPDITSNGRASFDQLLSNVFDPSLVIGAAYQAVTVETTRGRLVTGLLVEDSPRRVVLKTAGGKQEVVARKDVEGVNVSKLSLMPEGIEKQLKPQEIADLFAFLTLDRHPDDPKAKKIPGTPR